MIEGSLKADFTEGTYISESQAQRVMDTLIDDKVGLQRYYDVCLDCKAILNRRVRFIGTNIVYVANTDDNLTDAHKLTLVRLINVARKGQYIILIGDEVCYLPTWMRGSSEKDIRAHISYSRVNATIAAQPTLLDRVMHQFKLMHHTWTTPV